MGDQTTAPSAAPSELPKFGHGMLEQFCFPPGFINLNHGSFGSLPLPVLRATERLAIQAEQMPDLFFFSTAHRLLTNVRTELAQLVNADPEDCVVVNNATHGVNTVLFNLEWKEGDVIVQFSSTYGAVQRAIQMTVDRHPGLQLISVPVTYPLTHDTLLSRFHSTLAAIPRHPGQKVLALIDGIVSMPGVRWPWEEMVRIAREQGVLSLVDGAHLIGQVPVDLRKADPDFWISNCHKWLFSKRGSAVLYVPKRNQHLIKFTLPTSIGYVSPTDAVPAPEGSARFVKMFEYCGTIDYVPYLSISAALEFRKSIGGEERITEYCHKLAMDGGKKLAQMLRTEVMDQTGELTANMTNVRLPLTAPGLLSFDELRPLIFGTSQELMLQHNLMIMLYPHDNKWWARCSAQIWNEISDFEKAGEILLEVCKAKDQEIAKMIASRGDAKPELAKDNSAALDDLDPQ